MALNFGTDDIPESLEGYNYAGPGSYHFLVTGVDEGDGDAPLVLDVETLAGNPIAEVGKTHREYLNKPKAEQSADKRQNTVKRFLLLAVATGVVTEAELEAAKAAGRSPDLDFNLCIGRQFCGTLTAREYEGKKRCQLGYDMFAVDSEKAKGIPLNQEKLADQGTAAAATATSDPFGDF